MRGAQCATQAGLEGLAQCLRHELRPRGVDVSVVATGEFAAGTAWLSDSSMMEQVGKKKLHCILYYNERDYYLQAKIMWAQLSDEQKEAYGEDYFEQALRSLEKYTKVVS